MVKFGKKFFFNNTYLKKNKIFTIVISCSLVTLIIVTFFLTNYFYDKKSDLPKAKITVYEEIETEIYSSLPNILNYFKVLENVSSTEIEVTYANDFQYEENLDNCSEEQKNLINKIRNENYQGEDNEAVFSCVRYLSTQLGSFDVKFTIAKKEYSATLNVIDTTAPILKVKSFTIKEEDSYNAEDFLESCVDNSKEVCDIDFYNPEKGVKVDYANYTKPGEYEIKLIAKDSSRNTSEVATTTLTIKPIIYYTVTFNSNGGSSIDPQTIEENDLIYEPADPYKSGYDFTDWYLGNSKFDFNSPITSNITLIAHWKKTTSSGGGGSGGSGGGGSGGGGSGTCKYGTYDDYIGDISMYATLVNGRSLTDCTDKNGGETDPVYQTLISYSNKIFAEGGRLRTDLDEFVSCTYCGCTYCDIDYYRVNEGISNKSGLIGLNITIKVVVNGSQKTIINLVDCTSSYCDWY